MLDLCNLLTIEVKINRCRFISGRAVPQTSVRRCSKKQMFLEILQNSYFNTHTSKSLFETAIYNFIDKKTPPEACSCDFCKIFKNTFFKEHF